MTRSRDPRVNVYLLPSGRVVVRSRRFAISGAKRIAAGVAPCRLPQIYPLFVKTSDGGRAVLEALPHLRRGWDRSAWTACAHLYRARIKRVLAGEPVEDWPASEARFHLAGAA
jgi:hypothetical protein